MAVEETGGEKQNLSDGNVDNYASTVFLYSSAASNDDVYQPKLTASERKLGQSSISELESESQNSEQVRRDDEVYRFVRMSSFKPAIEKKPQV